MNEETDRARREGERDALLAALQRELEREVDRIEREARMRYERFEGRVKRLEGGTIGVLVGGCYLYLKSQGMVP